MKYLAPEGKMTSKERVLRTFNMEKTDRVPVNYMGNGNINQRMMEYVGAADYFQLLKCLGVDICGVNPIYTGPVLHHNHDGMNVDPIWGVHTKWIEHETGGYWDFCYFPLEDADEEEVAAFPFPNPDDYDYDATAETAKILGKDFAVHVGSAGIVDVINANGRLRGMEQTLVDLITQDEAGMLLTKRRLDIEYEIMVRTLDKCKGLIDFMWLGEDLGTQHAPMISLELYREVLKPWHKKFIDLAKDYKLPVMIHTCGSSSWAYEDFIEMGVTAVDTLQPEAANMSPRYLKDHFGGRLCFHGCISTAGPVAYGTPEDVENNVKETLEIMMDGGGYFFAPTHALQDNSPTENVVRMYESAYRYGKYE